MLRFLAMLPRAGSAQFHRTFKAVLIRTRTAAPSGSWPTTGQQLSRQHGLHALRSIRYSGESQRDQPRPDRRAFQLASVAPHRTRVTGIRTSTDRALCWHGIIRYRPPRLTSFGLEPRIITEPHLLRKAGFPNAARHGAFAAGTGLRAQQPD
jgi:hypothetical protein